jgi:hypothetical protein
MNKTTATPPTNGMSTLEKSLLGGPVKQAPALLPGLGVATLLAWLSIVLSE